MTSPKIPGSIFTEEVIKGAKIEAPAASDELDLTFDIPVGSISTIARVRTDGSVQVTGRSYHPSSHPRSHDAFGFEFEMNSVDPIRIRSAIEKNADRIRQVIGMVRGSAPELEMQAACTSVDLEVGLALLKRTRDPWY